MSNDTERGAAFKFFMLTGTPCFTSIKGRFDVNYLFYNKQGSRLRKKLPKYARQNR